MARQEIVAIAAENQEAIDTAYNTDVQRAMKAIFAKKKNIVSVAIQIEGPEIDITLEYDGQSFGLILKGK